MLPLSLPMFALNFLSSTLAKIYLRASAFDHEPQLFSLKANFRVLRFQAGISLIELIVVMGFIAVLITVGAISYRRSAEHADVLTAANSFRNALLQAQNNANSGVNRIGPRHCAGAGSYTSPTANPMEAWIVDISSATTYGVIMKCLGQSVTATFPAAAERDSLRTRYTLPAGVTFTGALTTGYGFRALNGGNLRCSRFLTTVAAPLGNNLGSYCIAITGPVNGEIFVQNSASRYQVLVEAGGVIRLQKIS